ncbi:MAG: S9 family peptidase [Steroidobacteraceae bacterium]
MRKQITSLVLGLSLLCTAAGAATREERGSLILEDIPEPATGLSERLGRYLAGREASFVDFLADGSMLVSTRFADTAQLHRLAAPLGAREQLTFFDEPVARASAPRVAGATRFAFMKDSGGNENAQILLYDLGNRHIRELTDGKSLHGQPLWSPDGKRIVFYGTGRDGVSHDIYVAEADSAAPPRLLLSAGERSWDPLDFSPDGRRLLLRYFVSINEAYLFLVDIDAPNPLAVDLGGGKVAVNDARFSPDGASLLVLTDRDSEFLHLERIDLASGAHEMLAAASNWDIEQFAVSADGRYLAYTANVGGYSQLNIVDRQSRLEMQPAGMPQGRIDGLAFDRSGQKLGMTIDSFSSPRDAWAYDLAANRVLRYTQSEVGLIDSRDLIEPQLVQFPTWDRVGGRTRQLPAFVFKPRQPGRHPVLMLLHGGPESQYRPNFEPLIQFVVSELGYAVVAPNVRGSSGYGKTFVALDNGRLREDSVRDVGALLVWVGAQPDLDASRVVVMGGSYGGYMALATMVNYGERLRGGIDVVGISNFVSFLTNTAPYRQDLRRVEYGDERDPAMRRFLSKISPLTNAARITKPLLVVQGMNDPRVPASESEQLVNMVRANKGQVWYLAARDEGHGFRKKQNRDVYQQTVVNFLQRLDAAATP